LVTASVATQATLEAEAYAAAQKVKVAVGGFDGNKSRDARTAFIEALKQDGGYEVTDAEDVKASAKGKAIVDIAKTLGVDLVITGKVSRGGVKLKLLNGADGKQLEEVEIKGAPAKLKGNIEQSGASSVAPAVNRIKASQEPAEEEPAPAPAEADADADASADSEASAAASTDDAGAGGLSPLDVTAGLRPIHRTFDFHHTLADVRPKEGFTQMQRYELPLGPALFIDLNWFPGSHATTGPAEWLGVTAGYEKGFAIQSISGEGTTEQKTLKTDTQAFYAGGRFRFPIGDHLVGATGTYGQHSFILRGDEGPNPLIPDVKYSYVKVGLDATLRFGGFTAGARAGKRFVLGTGPLETVWFPNVSTQSLEAGFTLGYRLANMLDLVAGLDWVRYAFDFNPVPVRPYYVAGGAVDEYMAGFIAFKFHVPGKGEKPAEE